MSTIYRNGLRLITSVFRRRMRWWQAVTLASGAVTITWALLSIAKSHGPFYLTGPYHVPLVAERIVGVLAVSGSVAVIIDLVRNPLGVARGVSFGATIMLAVTSIIGACLWRLATVPDEGGSIGGGAALLFGPFIVAGLLFMCVGIERRIGARRSSLTRWYVLAGSVGPVGLMVTIFVL